MTTSAVAVSEPPAAPPERQAPDLASALAAAQRAEQPLAQRVNELETALAAALEESDYLAADAAKNALPQARQALAIAGATSTALRQAVQVIEEQRQADERAVALRRQQDQAVVDLEAAQRQEQESAEVCTQHLAAAVAGLEAVRQSFQLAAQAEAAANGAECSQWHAREMLGQVPPGQTPPRYWSHRACDSHLMRDDALRVVVTGRSS